MTLVRRNTPGTTVWSCPEPATGDFWDNVLSQPSRKSKLKGESTRRYLEEHFTALMKDRELQKARIKVFREQMENPSLSQEEKDRLYQEFEKEQSEIARNARARLSASRFQRVKLIGRGGFGDVWLSQDKTSGELFALKILRKSDIILKDQLINVRTERDVLSSVDNPWIVQLYCSFQDDKHLYLVLEYLCGGDLMTALIKKGRFSEQETRFFGGEIALALHSIHEKHYLHRDLKPDNVLIGSNGHIKLTDFGLSTNYVKQDGSLHELLGEFQELILEHASIDKSVCHVRGGGCGGTCAYTAPEVLSGKEATTASDYWSLGVILYEMLFGFLPFMGKSVHETGLRIVHWKRSLRFPANAGVSETAVDLIKHLLCEPEKRFGYDEIVKHPFFKRFRFDSAQMNLPPIVPVIRGPSDTSHFDEIPPAPEDAIDQLPADELTQFAFLGYTFKQRPRSPVRPRGK